MTALTIGDMTQEELQQFVDAAIERKLQELLVPIQQTQVPQDRFRTWKEILASIDRNRWTPPLGAKSPLELLREDRDR